jgi:cytoskeleton protein RodZ
MADDPRRSSRYDGPPREPGPAGGWDEPRLGGGQGRESVGDLLRRERETYGLHLREVSESLRIRFAYLDAIERSAFDELPGPTYAVGFVRGYAQFLGLDDDSIVRRFKEESQGLKRDQELHFPEPVNEGKIPGGTILVLSILLIAAAYGAWAYLAEGERSVADLVPEVPESLQRMVGATEQPPAPEATDLASPERTQTADAAERETGEGSGNGGTAGADDGELAAQEVEELPETAPDEGGGTADDGAGDTETPTTGTAAGDDAAPEAPETAATDTAPGSDRTADASGPDAPEAPEADGTATAETTGSQTGAAGAEAPEAPEIDDGGTTATAEAGEGTEPAAGSSAADTASDPQRTANADTGPAGDGAAGDDGNPGPPDVPEIQQDDSGIPTAPEQTQTASTDDGGGGTSGRTFGASPSDSRVTLTATARSWVQVRGPDDSLVLTRLLRPGDRYLVPDRQGLTLHTGNAGGLKVAIDGTEIGRLGADGEVRRGILLEPQALGGG